jgi:alginate O-acetyltransferase complex protein AlgI
MLVMLIGGLWHGASWNFVIWGGIHGAMLAFERSQGKHGFYQRLPRPARVALTFAIVCVSWVFFRATTLGGAGEYLASMFGLADATAASDAVAGVIYTPYHTACFFICGLVVWTLPDTWTFTERLTPSRAVSGFALLTVAVLLMWTQTVNPFLYFQF